MHSFARYLTLPATLLLVLSLLMTLSASPVPPSSATSDPTPEPIRTEFRAIPFPDKGRGPAERSGVAYRVEMADVTSTYSVRNVSTLSSLIVFSYHASTPASPTLPSSIGSIPSDAATTQVERGTSITSLGPATQPSVSQTAAMSSDSSAISEAKRVKIYEVTGLLAVVGVGWGVVWLP